MSRLQVLFRYAIAIFKCLEKRLLTQTDYMTTYHTLRNEVADLRDVKTLTQVSE